MSSELLAYESVPTGFESVIGNTDVGMGKIWNLWFNVTLSDDPGKWDAQIRAINDMQKRLGDLPDEHRLIRAHMAEFCRYDPSFPDSVDWLCKETGASSIQAPPSLGCEGRDLLQSLGYHQDADVAAGVQAQLRAIGAGLQRWRERKGAANATERQVLLFLGEHTESKREFAERPLSVLSSDDDSIQPLRQLTEKRCEAALETLESRGRPFNCFNCLAPDETCPMCKCSFTMLALAGMLCADTPTPDKPPEKLFQTFVQEHVLVYAAALNAWLSDDGRATPVSLPSMASVSEADAVDIAAGIRKALGRKDPFKTWLAACLLKTVVGSQRWHRGSELIDDLPEATSYLRGLETTTT